MRNILGCPAQDSWRMKYSLTIISYITVGVGGIWRIDLQKEDHSTLVLPRLGAETEGSP